MIGFTGVVWDARTTERLASDLAAGAGPGPLAEAGIAWGQLAGALADAGLDYAAILDRIGVNWASAHSDSVQQKLTSLIGWFANVAGEAGHNAARAEAQAAANTVARLSMPNLAETDLLEKMREVATATSAIAPALMGAAAHAERALHDQRMRAARVMSTYEVASEPAAHPWMPASPAPMIVSANALHAEQAARESVTNARHAAPGAPSAPTVAPMPAGIPMSIGVAEPDRVRYAPTILAGGVQSTMFTPAPASPTAPSAPMPPPMTPGAMATSNERVVARAAVVDESGAAAASSSAAEADVLDTWEAVAAADSPVAHHVSEPAPRALDSRYLTETLSLGSSGGR